MTTKVKDTRKNVAAEELLRAKPGKRTHRFGRRLKVKVPR